MTFGRKPLHRRELEPFEKRGDSKLPFTEARRLRLQRQLGSHVTIVGFDALDAMGETLNVPMTAEELANFKVTAQPIINRLAAQYGPKPVDTAEL